MNTCGAVVCFLALTGCIAAQENPAPEQQDPAAGFVGNDQTAAVIAGVQVQQYMSSKFGHLLLDMQSAMGWMQVVNSWQQMSYMESQGNELYNFEESSDNSESESEEVAAKPRQMEEFVPFMGGMGMGMGMGTPQPQSGNRYDQAERSGEQALLMVLKIMYIQAAQKLHSVQQSHFQMRLQVAMIQQLGAAGPLGQILSLMYSLETMKLMGSAISIQRQDAWNTWMHDEIMETELFDNSRAPVPAAFRAQMDQRELIAMQLYASEAMIDMTVITLEMYVQMAVGQLTQAAAAASAAPPATEPPVAQPTALLEEEVTAEPSATSFTPFMAPQYMQMYLPYMKYMAAMMNMYAAQGFMASAQMRQQASGDAVQYAAMSRTHALQALQQWAWLKITLATFEWYSMYSMMAMAQGGAPGAAAHASA